MQENILRDLRYCLEKGYWLQSLRLLQLDPCVSYVPQDENNTSAFATTERALAHKINTQLKLEDGAKKPTVKNERVPVIFPEAMDTFLESRFERCADM